MGLKNKSTLPPRGTFKAQLQDFKYRENVEKRKEYLKASFLCENGAYFDLMVVITPNNEKFSVKEARILINAIAPNFSSQEASIFYSTGDFPRKGVFGQWYLVSCEDPTIEYPKYKVLNQTDAPKRINTQDYEPHHPNVDSNTGEVLENEVQPPFNPDSWT